MHVSHCVIKALHSATIKQMVDGKFYLVQCKECSYVLVYFIPKMVNYDLV